MSDVAEQAFDPKVIEESLTIVAETCEDPAPLIYEKLFAKLPEVEELFILDTTKAARGHMQFQALECIFDLMGENGFARTLIQSERINHDGLGIPVETFRQFFPVMKDAFAEIAGTRWTPDIEAAWQGLLDDIDRIIEEG